jgi:hypothetical protein
MVGISSKGPKPTPVKAGLAKGTPGKPVAGTKFVTAGGFPKKALVISAPGATKPAAAGGSTPQAAPAADAAPVKQEAGEAAVKQEPEAATVTEAAATEAAAPTTEAAATTTVATKARRRWAPISAGAYHSGEAGLMAWDGSQRLIAGWKCTFAGNTRSRGLSCCCVAGHRALRCSAPYGAGAVLNLSPSSASQQPLVLV